MSKVYKSRIGPELWATLIPVTIAMFFMVMQEDRKWYGIVILCLVFVFIIHLLMTTDYTIEKEKLLIRSGIIYRQTIDIQSIHRIVETFNPLSSPALSLDRLKIYYGNRKAVMISPRDKRQFVNHIKSINSTVEIVYRSR
ncbi:MAG TPA: PH domain-containing protein [Flavihumibacter sp.]|jgi:membrane protein YdbS with pleckstrin-like domain